MVGSIAQSIASVIGESRVVPREEMAPALQQVLESSVAADGQPTCMASPQTVSELAAVVTCAHSHRWRILPCGHGSKLAWGSRLNGADIVVSTQQLTRVIEHAVGDLTVTVEAGVPFAELQGALLKTRQFLAIDPAYGQRATLGGIVATRDTGALRQRYGGIRDMLIGVSFVRHDGQIAKAGGRVVKNVAGYDLMKLMTGAWGTLGILTQLTFRTYPLQEEAKTTVIRGDAEAVQNILGQVRRSSLTPTALDLISPTLLSPDHVDVYGLALQFQSMSAAVTEQIDVLQAIAHPLPVTLEILSNDAEPQFWQTLGETLFPLEPDSDAVVAQTGVLPDKSVALCLFLQSTLALGSWQLRIHTSSGIGILRLQASRNSPTQLAQVRSYCQSAGGYLNVLEAPGAWKSQVPPWALTPASTMLMTRLRDQFDPYRLLSPGRFPEQGT